MSTFDPFADSPFQIKSEGQEIVVTQTRLSPSTIRISWTLPKNVSCDIPAAYNGAIVTIDRTPSTLIKSPSDGSTYVGDPTADTNLHTGNKISSALVVGAFYNDKTTTYLDIHDAPSSEPFYATVHAVDQVFRYHTDGAHSYALNLGRDSQELPTAGYQIVPIGTGGIFTTTPTGLLVGTTYTFRMCIDSETDVLISIDGTNAQTYGDLINALNVAFINKFTPLTTSNSIPLLDTFWYDNVLKQVKHFTGDTYEVVSNVITSNSDPLLPIVNSYWLNTTSNQLMQWNGVQYDPVSFFTLGRDPRHPYCNDYWFDGVKLFKWNGGIWLEQTLINAQIDPSLPPGLNCNNYWFHDGHLYVWNSNTCMWVEVTFVTTAPTTPVGGTLWFDSTSNILKIWDGVDNTWVVIPVFVGAIDPQLGPLLNQGIVWFDNIVGKYFVRDGSSWLQIVPIDSAVKPQNIPDGSIWFNTQDKKWYKLGMGLWSVITVLPNLTAPNIPVDGTYWYNPSLSQLNQLVLGVWTNIPLSPTPVLPTIGMYWYNPTAVGLENQVKRWTGKMWSPVMPKVVASLTADGNIQLQSSTTGSGSWAGISDLGSLWILGSLTPNANAMNPPVKGTDPVSTLPSYMQVGVGTDGSPDERRNMIEVIKTVLGYPSVGVELTKHAMDVALDMAFQKLRQASSAAYKRGYFGLDLQPRVQHYILSDQTVGFNKIVEVMYLYRRQTSFLGTAAGNDVYGQMMIQNLFNMGKFDLLSYHLVSSQIETMNQVFAAEIQFNWDERTRRLSIYKDFPKAERVLVDATIERTEQDLLTDRVTRDWIQKYATAQCRYMLADIRGKFSTLPGAGGNLSLNSSDLRTKADEEIRQCMEEIDNFVVNDKTSFGLATDFVFG